ncbi:MAG: ester cyclase [Leptolyngbyaceae cyanobacterium RU_5_1]|nr:ester cyclase [Leptolyngbyaceae cyanobacterium RU_5_1]
MIHEVIEQFIEQLWNQRQLNLADELFPADFVARPVAHQPRWDGVGSDSMKHHIQEWLEGIPDLHMNAIKVLAQGNQSFVPWEMTGTHTGVLYGVPPTGKPIRALGITFLKFQRARFENCKPCLMRWD